MCMHDNPLRIKVEVEDASASPSPAPKITGTDVEMKDLMSDVGSLKAFAEATTESATAVADIIDPIEHGGLVEPSATAEASAVAEESAAAAAAVTMMGMGGGGDNSGKRRRASMVGLGIITTLSGILKRGTPPANRLGTNLKIVRSTVKGDTVFLHSPINKGYNVMPLG